jgi:ABC-2 type transport system ATP-binding protein
MPVKSVVVDNVTLHYGTVEALHGVSITVEAGDVVGLLGPNGAGKTSVLRVLVGLRRPTSGRAWVLGHDVAADVRSVRRLVGYVPQAISADGSLTGRENASLFARLYGLSGRRRRERVAHVLSLMGLDAVADSLVSSYSGGMVRRLEIACALVSSPRVLLLDEPTLGLDPGARRGVWEHLHAQRSEADMSVLVTTHYMEEAQEHCARVVVLSDGQVLAEDTPTGLRSGLGPGATLEDVFIALTGTGLSEGKGGLHEVRRSRRTARRLG